MVAPVSLAFDIFKDKRQFRLAGRVQTTLELPCSRCLEPFTAPVDAAFDLRYQPHAVNTGEGEREIEEDDLTTAFYENDEIDLGHLMREQFVLSLPMKPLCGDACRGLCPICGTNLNRGACGCTRAWEDPRLAAAEDRCEERRSRTLHEYGRIDDAESKTTTLQDAHGEAPDARRAQGRRPLRVPALPRAEAAAPRLRQLRLLPRTPGARGRRGQRCSTENRTGSSDVFPMIWIAVDAMGGDHAPPSRRRRAGGRASFRSRRAARRPDVAARGRARPASRRSMADRVRGGRRARRRGDGGVAGRGAAAQADGVDQGRRRVRGARRGRRRSSARATPARRSWRPIRRSACCRASIGRRWPPPFRRGPSAGHPARRRRQRRVPAPASAAVRGHGQRVRARGVRHRLAAGRPAVDRRRGDQGQRADARGAPAAQGVAARLHRQHRGARRLQRRRRRHRLRRLHGQRGAEDQRGAGRRGRGIC